MSSFIRIFCAAADSTCVRSVRSAFPEQAPYMEAAGAGHPEPGIPAPGCRLSMLKSRRLLRESGEEAAICIVVTICTAPARLGAVVLTSAWLEDGPRRRTRSQRVAVVVAHVAPALLRSSSMEALERPSAQDPAESGHECRNRGTATMSRSSAHTHTRRWHACGGVSK